MYWKTENENGRVIELELSIHFVQFRPEQGPLFSSGGQPAQLEELDVEGASLAGINWSYIELCKGHRLIPSNDEVLDSINENSNKQMR